MLALNNLVPMAVAILSSQMKMKGLRAKTRATVNRIRKTPYARALRMNNKVETNIQRGQMKNRETAAGW